ncbi:MAG TPA: TolC family protein [Bacteroidales bacterium]|nr:TolC family protein [Bacteroidales bacterium]
MNNKHHKNFFQILLVSSLLVWNQSLFSQEGTTVSFKECLKKAREYHPYYSDRQRIEQSNELKIKNIQSMWLPQMNLNAQATYQSEATKVNVPIPGVEIPGASLDQYKVTLDVNQVIFDGGASRAQKKLANSSVEADLQQNETDIYKINEQVSNVYFNALLLQVSRNLYKNTLEDLGSKEQKIASGVRNGILIQSDLDNLKVEILKTRQLINEIEFSYSSALRILSELTGDSTVANASLLAPEVNLLNHDTVNRPELKLFDLQKNVLDWSKSISSSQRLPKLYAFSQLGYGRPGLNMLKDEFQSFYIVGLKLQWNIWDWNKTSHEKSMYSIQQDLIDSRKELYLRNLRISETNETTRINQLEDALKTDEEIVKLRKNISLQTEKRLDQGIVTMTDYLTEYNAEIKAGLQFETHKIQLMQSKSNYLIIQGIL